MKLTQLTFLLLLAGLFVIMSCQSKAANNIDSNPDELAEGQAIFKQYCVICHGADGKLQLNGAKDLTLSELTLEQRVAMIQNGKNLMTPFEGILTPDQMQAVATYSLTIQ